VTDRAAILRRRAFFVTSALSSLTGLGCDKDRAPAPVPSVDTTTPPTSVATATAAPSAASSATPPPQDMPSLDVPSGVNETATEHYRQLGVVVPRLHAELDAIEAEFRKFCEPATKACDGDWADLAKRLARFDDERRSMPPRCGGESDDAKAYMAHQRAHDELLGQRRKALDERVASWLDEAGRARWQASLAAAAIPRPCLRFRCDPW
jgi:hypothetical protein